MAPDPVTADILARHAAGEKLTSQQYGTLGAWKAKLKAFFPGKGGPDAGPTQPGLAARNPAALAPLAPAQASDPGLELVPVDTAVAQRCAGALLKRADAISVRLIERAARNAGAGDKALDRFRSAASFSADDRALMVDLAPDICAELSINPRRFALYIAAGVMGLHATNIWLAIEELKALQIRTNAPAPAPAVASAAVPGPGPVLPRRADPPGAPIKVTA